MNFDSLQRFFAENKNCLILLMIIFALGTFLGYKIRGEVVKTEIKTVEVPIKGEVQTETKTVVQYVPKIISVDASGNKVPEKTDVEAKIAKTELHVKVNGQEQTIKKTDDERFVLDKNKLEMNQTSVATVDVKIPTVDNTKRFGIGVGASKNGIAYNASFPVGKKVDGWLYHDKNVNAVGVMMKF